MAGVTSILCGTDFSDEAREAGRVAAAWAGCLGATVTLAHVIDELGAEDDFAADPDTPRYAARRTELDREADALAREFRVSVGRVLAAGAAADHLLRAAHATGSELVVVSSLGRRKQHRWLLGSVAERIAQLSDCPVLVVRNSAPLVEWAAKRHALKVIAALDYSAASRAIVAWMGTLRSCAPCDVHFTRIADPANESERFGFAPSESGRVRPHVERLLRRELRRWTGTPPGDGRVSWSLRPRTERIEDDITREAERIEADLIVVGSTARTRTARFWQGSVSHGVLHLADGNALVVPPGSGASAAVTVLNRMLVCTDFTDAANRAIPVAYGLVNAGGVVHLLHVVAAGEEQPSEPDAAHIETRLRELVPDEAEARRIITVTEVIAAEHPHAGILQVAARRAVDAICLATHGRGAIGQVVLGSNAQEVVQRARQPVVLIPPDLP